MTVRIIEGDCRDVLRTLDAGSVQCCVTSPPYFGLRDYGHAEQIGLEATPDAYVAAMVDVFRCVRDVLADDGTLWLNLGDSYAGGGGFCATAPSTATSKSGKYGTAGASMRSAGDVPGLKSKDLIGIPWRVAFALQADGWYLRQDIIWHKPNPMPESVRDRCTKAHEYVFLLSKSDRYYFDSEAMQEPSAAPEATAARYRSAFGGAKARAPIGDAGIDTRTRPEGMREWGGTRNRRSVWTIAMQPYAGAHFATMAPALARDCVLAGCPEGGTVLDPFGGAGTTGLVADRLHRDAVLVEINPEYAALARRRIADESPLFSEIN